VTRVDRIRAACQKAAVEAVLDANDASIELLVKRMDVALQVLKSPFPDLEELGEFLSWPLTNAAAAECGSRCREMLGAGDIEPLFALPRLLAERLNVFVMLIESDRIVSGRALIDGGAFIFLTKTRFEHLFRCARELSWLLMDGMPTRSAPEVVFESVANEDRALNGGRVGPYARFANGFADALLVPARGLALSLQEVRRVLQVEGDAVGDVELLYLARIFGVSFRCVARRCERLDLLPKGSAALLEKYLRSRFGGADDRASNLDLPPRPDLPIDEVPAAIAEATIRAVRNGLLTPERAVDVFGKPMAAQFRAQSTE
jgi:hypothetical protein